MGLSRDDAGRFLPDYVDEKKAGIFHDDPFQTLDQDGVGMLIGWAIEQRPQHQAEIEDRHLRRTRRRRRERKILPRAGMDYVSASPFRVPIARLAAAQAVIEAKETPKKSARPRKPKAARAARAASS